MAIYMAIYVCIWLYFEGSKCVWGGGECTGQRIAVLLYAYHMVLFADDEEAMCWSLRMLQE